MTINELIIELSKYDPNLKVFVNQIDLSKVHNIFLLNSYEGLEGIIHENIAVING